MAGLTMFSSIMGIDPNDVPDFDAYPVDESWPSDRALTDEQKRLIRELIAEVLKI